MKELKRIKLDDSFDLTNIMNILQKEDLSNVKEDIYEEVSDEKFIRIIEKEESEINFIF